MIEYTRLENLAIWGFIYLEATAICVFATLYLVLKKSYRRIVTANKQIHHLNDKSDSENKSDNVRQNTIVECKFEQCGNNTVKDNCAGKNSNTHANPTHTFDYTPKSTINEYDHLIKKELKGKDLVCWCAPLPCHADVLLELANA